jgi:hypothetical protein
LQSLALVAVIMVAVGALPLRTAHATCGEECDGQYSSAIDDCRSQYGDGPADADDLTNCIQEAKDDYRNCLDDCASAAIFATRSAYPWWRLRPPCGSDRSVGVRRAIELQPALGLAPPPECPQNIARSPDGQVALGWGCSGLMPPRNARVRSQRSLPGVPCTMG